MSIMNHLEHEQREVLSKTGRLTLNTIELSNFLNYLYIEFDEENDAFFIPDIGYSIIPDNFWINTEWVREDGIWILSHIDSELFELHFSFL